MKRFFLSILFLLLSVCSYAQIDSLKPELKKLNKYELNGVEYSTQGLELERPFTVLLTDSSGNLLPNVSIIYSIVSEPPNAKGTKIYSKIAKTDSNGIASTKVKLGDQPGNYLFSARIKNYSGGNEPIYLSVVAREGNWVFILISGMIGGLGLFLFGMNLLSSGLKKTAGNKLRSILSLVTTNRVVAVGIGTLITMIISSSSATTVMLVSFVQANLMTFTQTLGILLGASIGTTVTLQLIAFKITDFALIIIGFGFIPYFFINSKKIRNIGEAVVGFGILFFGMSVMSGAMSPLKTYQPFIDILLQLENPLVGILVGTLLTALIQSSAAFLGIVLILSMQGLITLDAAIPLIFGANIGTSITAILASIKSSRDAKRVAIAHTLFKVAAVMIAVWFIEPFSKFIETITMYLGESSSLSASGQATIPREIANAHTVFNVAFTILFLPFLSPIAKLIYKIFPDKEEIIISPYKTRFIEESLITTPALALSLAKAEIVSIADKVKLMTEKIIIPFFEDKPEILDEIKELEKEVDFLQLKTSRYLTKISQQDLEENLAEESFQLMQCSIEYEAIADLTSSRMRTLAKKRIKYNLEFSPQGKEELSKFHLRTVKQVSRSIDVFKDTTFEQTQKLERKYQKYKAGELDLKRSHFERVRSDVSEAIQTNELHLELIDLFLRINRHAASIGRVLTGDLELSDEDSNGSLSNHEN